MQEKSANQAHLVNEGKLNRVSVNRVHSVAKGFCKFTVLTKHMLVNIRNHFKTSVYRVGSANEGFSYFGILILIDLSIGSSRLW